LQRAYCGKGDYESCRFTNCEFSNADLGNITFIDCEFEGCNLSMANITKIALQKIQFVNCKMLGLHFENCNQFGLSLNVDTCNLSHSSFYQATLKRRRLKIPNFTMWILPNSSHQKNVSNALPLKKGNRK
jgi:uncharacterized protein YjbI with pentapeptide repeats